ncbi:MAG: carboxypeptidase regulatory-like domain-containing protein [Pyrinomonadaceae bacterium]
MFGRILKRVFTLTLLLSAFAAFSIAQDLDDVTIAGRVTDANGLAVVGATITVTSVETGVLRTIVTDEDGRYQIVKLKPGTYKVKAALSGFGPQETPGIATVSAQNLIKDFKLSPADVRAEATVTITEDDGPVVDTGRITVGGTITSREIEEIPNNTRNALDLVLTLGGTSEEQLSTSGLAEDRLQAPSGAPLEQGNFSISGGTAYSNNITIDGLDNNDDRSSRDRFQPSIESIAEVQVIANQFSAEYGRAAGGRVNIRTRAGGNTFRGRAFMFFRDESLNANSWYNNSRNIRRPALQQINPGFTLSGPVVLPGIFNGRNKTFFSVAYERDALADTTLIDAYVPVVQNPRYPLQAPTGSTRVCDVAGSPAPPCAAGVAEIGQYNRLYDTPNLSNVFTARIDTKLFKDNDFTFGFQFGRKNNKRTSGATVNRLENAFQAKNINTEAYNFTDNHVFGAKAVNQLRAQWSTYKPSFQAPDPFDPVLIISIRDPLVGVESLVLGNSTVSSGSNFPDTRNETRWQIQDSFTYIKGNHTFKTGFDYQSVVSKVTGLGDATGTFSFASAFAFTQSQLSRYLQNFGTAQDTRNKYIGFFFNDQFKPIDNVTMSLGVRYEKETAVADNNNIGPRFGVSWDPFKSGRGVIRFGAGIFYNRVLLRTVGESIQNTLGSQINFSTNTIGTGATDPRRVAILAALSTNFPNTYASVDELRALVTSACATVIAPPAPCTANTGFTRGNISEGGTPIRSVDPDLKIPESYQFNVGFERELFQGWVFEANYTWNKTVHLWRDKNANAPRLPTGFSDWTSWLLANTYSIPNQNGTTRTYSFVLGPTNDATGVGACNFTTTNTCVVNLNSTNGGFTAPAAASTGNNNNAAGSPIGIATTAIGRFRPDQTLADEASRIGSLGNAFYQGLILEMRSRYRKLGGGFGASFRFAYTLSKTMDDGLNNTANAEVNGDFSREWARNLQDRRHRFALSGTFDAPRWLGSLKFSPLFRAGTSAPFNLGAGGADRNLDDLGTDRINFSGDLKDIVWRAPGTPVPTALLAQFSLQPIGSRSGNLPRNSGTGPSFFTFDLSVTREFKFGERMRFRPVMEFGNILNAAVFSYGSAFIDFGVTATAQNNFLIPTRTYRQRDIRLGMRFDF